MRALGLLGFLELLGFGDESPCQQIRFRALGFRVV